MLILNYLLCVVFLISQRNVISHQKTKKKDFDTQQVYVSFNLALLKKELMLKSTIHVG